MTLLALGFWLGIITIAVIGSYWIAAVILRPRQFPDDNIERDIAHGDPRLSKILTTHDSPIIIKGE